MKRNALPELSYFELQAYVGTTKHMGGLETTVELIDLCHVDAGAYVLDVGCGVGATACYLAKTVGCKVMAVDLRASMVALANERAGREGVADRVEARVADALDLPFEEGAFDIVLCESVATFVEDKVRVARELLRVARQGGRIGLNEEIWVQPPPGEIVGYVKRTWGIEPDIPTADAWLTMLEGAGLRDVIVRPYRFDARRESTQLKRYRLRDTLRMLYRTLWLYLVNPEFRAYMRERKDVPKGLFEYLGYALFVGNK